MLLTTFDTMCLISTQCERAHWQRTNRWQSGAPLVSWQTAVTEVFLAWSYSVKMVYFMSKSVKVTQCPCKHGNILSLLSVCTVKLREESTMDIIIPCMPIILGTPLPLHMAICRGNDYHYISCNFYLHPSGIFSQRQREVCLRRRQGWDGNPWWFFKPHFQLDKLCPHVVANC